MAIQPLNIETKQDNAQKLEQTANLPSKEIIKADEFNKVVAKVNEVINYDATLDNLNLLQLYNEKLTNE